MKINLLEIQTYRSCIKTSVPLNTELTSLIGVNGAGKSNILNALLLLKKLCRPRLSPSQDSDSVHNHCRILVEIEHKDLALAIRSNIVFETDERNVDEVVDTRLQWKLGSADSKAAWLDFPIESLAFNYNRRRYLGSDSSNTIARRWRYINNVNSKNKASTRMSNKYFPIISDIVSLFDGINYYSASQFSDPSRCPVSIELEDNRPIKRLRRAVSHEQFILDLYRSYKAQNTQFKRYLKAINKDGIGLVDHIEFSEFDMPSSSYEVRSGIKLKKIERARLLIVPNFTIDEKRLSPNQLSEGTFKTLALLFYVLTDDSHLLLIEEPEVCIHHGLLDSILSLIKMQAKQKQIVISTHSDFVLDQLKPENIVLVKRDSKQGTKAQLLSKSMSKNDFKALRSYLEETGNLGEYWKEAGFDNEE